MLQFPCHILGIAGHDDAAYHKRGIVCDDELGTVGQVNRNPVTLFDPQLLQGSSELQGQLQQSPISHGCVHERIAQGLHDVAVDHCCLVWKLGSSIYQKLVQWGLGVVDRCRYAGIILVEPGLLHPLRLLSLQACMDQVTRILLSRNRYSARLSVGEYTRE